ncbi:MAG: 2OG-Fe(II) oxygenase [Pseudomonadota bacterium]|nr:2OG-Fe(II) oxygenase [Pseudomonadota bacterium]
MAIEPAIGADGISVRDDFLAPIEVRALVDCANLRRARGDFAAGRIGNDRTLRRRKDIRGDSICWIAPPLFPAELSLLRALELLRLELNREAWLGLFELELHYAWYPPGAGYSRHVDQPMGRAQRRISLVLYLNEEWRPGAGGELRVFDANGGSRDIEPIAGRLVCFLTAEREHEVLPTRQHRLSVTGWLRARD